MPNGMSETGQFVILVRQFMHKLNRYAELTWAIPDKVELDGILTEDEGTTWEAVGYDRWGDRWSRPVPQEVLLLPADGVDAYVAAEQEAHRLAVEENKRLEAERLRIQKEKRAAAQEEADRAKLAELKAKYPDG